MLLSFIYIVSYIRLKELLRVINTLAKSSAIFFQRKTIYDFLFAFQDPGSIYRRDLPEKEMIAPE